MEQRINEPVKVQARVYRGKSRPLFLTWKGRTYQIIDAAREQPEHGQKSDIEIFSAAIVDLRRIKLMYDHNKKEWTLLSID